MSTEYELGHGVTAVESSSRISIGVVVEEGIHHHFYKFSESMDEHQLRALIVKLIHSCSYISEDPSDILARFNVTYQDKA